MSLKKIIILLIAAVLLLGVIDFFAEKSVVPIEGNAVSYIEFRIYPQNTVNFTIADDDRINEIVSIINSLAIEKTDARPERMGEYFYHINLQCSDGDNIWVEFDESTLSLNNENYTADTKKLHELLEKTYHEIQNGNME